MFLDHPFTGVGIGNYGTAYAPYHITIFVNSLDHAHNYYINTAAETGIIGLTTFVLFLFAMFVAGTCAYRGISKRYRQLKAEQTKPKVGISPFAMLQASNTLSIFTNDRALAIGLFASLLTICVHNFVDNLYVHGLTMLFALLIVALVRLGRIHSETSGERLGS
jgi:O-antigen ligase